MAIARTSLSRDHLGRVASATSRRVSRRSLGVAPLGEARGEMMGDTWSSMERTLASDEEQLASRLERSDRTLRTGLLAVLRVTRS